MAKTTRRSKRAKAKVEESEQPTTQAELGGANQVTDSQAKRNEINRRIAENKEREQQRALHEMRTSPSQTATSEDLNDAEQKRRDAEAATEIGVVRAARRDVALKAIDANQDPAVMRHEMQVAQEGFDKERARAKDKTRGVEDDPAVGVQPLVVTEGNVPQTSINSRTTTVDPRTTTLTNRRDGNTPSGDVELAIRSASISGRIDGTPAHVPPDLVDAVRSADDEQRQRILHGANVRTGISGVVGPVPPRARPLGETSLKEAQGLPHVAEHSVTGLVGTVNPWDVERHDAPSQNVSGTRSMHVADSFQTQRAAEEERRRVEEENRQAQLAAEERKERRSKLKTRKPKGAPRAKGNKGKRKGKAGSKH